MNLVVDCFDVLELYRQTYECVALSDARSLKR